LIDLIFGTSCSYFFEPDDDGDDNDGDGDDNDGDGDDNDGDGDDNDDHVVCLNTNYKLKTVVRFIIK
jgi:hypothetical protein